MSEAGSLIKRIAGTPDEQIHICTVSNVQDRTCDCDPIDGHAKLINVRLNAVVIDSTAGITIKPKQGSEVIVHQINQKDSYIAQYSEIESIYIEIGTFKIDLNSNAMVFNNGINGLVKIDKLIEKINRLESKLKTHQHAYINAGGVTTPTTIIPADTTMVFANTTQTEIEDTKIKH